MADETKPSETKPSKTKLSGDHDRVTMASRKPDGTPDQTPDFEYIGDREVTLAQTKRQLGEQAVSAIDVEQRAAAAAEEEVPQDATIAENIKLHEAAVKDTDKQAEAEVKAKFTDEG